MVGYEPDGRPGVPPEWVRASGAVALDTGFLVADTQLYKRGGLLCGWTVGEVAGTPALAAFEIRDGGANGSQMLARVNIAASGMSEAWFGPPFVTFQTALFIHQITGVSTGALYIIPNE